MSRVGRIYLALAAIFASSLLAAVLLPVAPQLRTVAGIPAVGALFAALLQVLRDEAAHEKAVLLQGLQHSFAVGATSHMAHVAFDKHVAFAEEYVSEMFETVSTLFRDGPSAHALDHAAKLYAIRRKHAVWLTPELERRLVPFEAGLRKIGSYARVASTAPGASGHSQRVHEMHDILVEVLGTELESLESEPEDDESERAIRSVVGRLRAVLGIEELTRMREALVREAVERVGRAG